MQICYKNNQFVTRQNPKDKRRIQYLLKRYEKQKWVNRETIIDYIKGFEIKNAKLVGNDIVYVKPEIVVKRITERLYNELENFAEKYLKYSNSVYDYNVHFLNSLLQNERREQNKQNYLKSGYLMYDGNSIIGLFSVDKIFDVPVIYTLYSQYDTNLYKAAKIISAQIPNCIFYNEYFNDCFKDTSFKLLSFKSTINPEKEYSFYHGCYLTEYDTDILVKEVEKRYFPDLKNISQIVIKHFKGIELEQYLKKLRTDDFNAIWGTRSSTPAILGFHYLNYDDISSHSKDKDFLVALYKGIIVGVIKYGVWQDANYQSLAYIDVNEKYQRMGIASLMISNIDKFLFSKLPMVLTSESEMGAKCHMAERFKKAITKVSVKTYEECLKTGSYI